MEIIVLSITKYKEKDAIINAISKDGAISLTAKGILDPKCKNNELNNILTYVDVDFIEGDYKYPLLKRHKVLAKAADAGSDFYRMGVSMLISEAACNLVSDDERGLLFDDTLLAINALNSGVDPFKVALIYLSKIIKIAGYEFEINHCVYCGSKEHIVAFSFEEGGFICKKCSSEATKNDLSPNQLLLLRASFMAKEFNLPDKLFNKIDALYLLNKYSEFLYDGVGYKLNTINLISK